MGGGGGGGSYAGTNDIDKLEGLAREEIRKETQPSRRRVFVSFRHTDKTKVDLLRGQAKNENAELDFIDMGLRVPFDSENAEYIRSGIRSRIEQSSVTLVAVSETTYESKWVNWEIRESLKMGKGVVVVNISNDSSIRMPDAVNENRSKIKIVSWNHSEIMSAINSAS
jgi:hypothetical protein